jgi:hypothetical protein
MRKWLFLIAVFISLSFSFQVQAQNETRLSSVTVNIWPEYDQPSVLVINHISLSPDTKLPTTLSIRIPAQAEVFAVAVSDPVNGLLNTPYDRIVEGSWATLTINTNLRDVQVEYYDVLAKNETARHIVFEWSSNYAIDRFAVAFQQPVGATEIVTNPILTASNAGQDGFIYFQSTPQPLAAGQSYHLTIDYQKSSDALSTTGLPVEPSQPINSSTPGRVTMSYVLPWILAGIGGALLLVGIVGGLYFWKSGPRDSLKNRRRHPQQQRTSENSEVYCNQCGKRAQPGDVYCRTCGSRLKKEG